MIRQFTIAALLAGAISAVPSVSRADGWQNENHRARVQQDRRHEREDELRVRLRNERARFLADETAERARFHARYGWDRMRCAEFDRRESFERVRFEEGLRRQWMRGHGRIERAWD